ncbi:MAG TPA: choice-of-anchor Q domain-containing protein, partial [Rudaea sp.]
NIDITSYPYAKGATISDNVANGIDSSGGGLFASNTYGPGRITLSASTVSRNQASKSSARGDPKLGPLKFNGGHTMTHALLPGSPAINRGEGSPAEYDQRGKPYSRVDGAAADIGAFETSDRFFFDGFDP